MSLTVRFLLVVERLTVENLYTELITNGEVLEFVPEHVLALGEHVRVQLDRGKLGIGSSGRIGWIGEDYAFQRKLDILLERYQEVDLVSRDVIGVAVLVAQLHAEELVVVDYGRSERASSGC